MGARVFVCVQEVVKRAIDEFELAEHALKAVREYSGGTMRKLCAAIALIGNPDLMFATATAAAAAAAAARRDLRHCAVLRRCDGLPFGMQRRQPRERMQRRSPHSRRHAWRVQRSAGCCSSWCAPRSQRSNSAMVQLPRRAVDRDGPAEQAARVGRPAAQEGREGETYYTDARAQSRPRTGVFHRRMPTAVRVAVRRWSC